MALTSSRECGKFVFPGILRSNWKHINAPDAISFHPSDCSLRGNKTTQEYAEVAGRIDPKDNSWSRAVFKV